MQVIESAVDCGDGVSIEREQPSTAFKTMPHMVTFLKPQPIDERTGNFDALNETTNVRPNKGESISIVHPEFRTGLISPDQMRPVDSLSETFGDGDPRILGPISGEGVFKPQDIDTKGSVIFGDNHFMPDRGGDSLMGMRHPTGPIGSKIWTNGGASTFEDRPVGDYDANDAVFGVKENIDWTAANGGPGSSYLTAKTASKANAYVDEDVDGFMKLGDIKGELQTTDITRENRFFEELIQGSDFVASTNPVHELGGTAGPCGSSFMTEKTGANPGQMLSPLSGGDGCPF